MSGSADTRLLHLVVCAAPPARHIAELIEPVQHDNWNVHIIATETAHTWLPTERLATITGQPVSYRQRHPDEPSVLSRADAIAVVPATFNTINKWATGINDSLALGILNESFGAGLPIIASPYVKPTLARHPAFTTNLRLLADHGVRLTPTQALRPTQDDQPFRWEIILDELQKLTAP
ncbi:flavoprotein [Micromonospora inyonensis]|uniref:Glycosyl transferases group 1 n=1 Tax=Micromonospora inyonensis TaxID=47866 RepID=A0A1C6S5E4_9ACTN|nr:flavoprotein [Micromonospora inyonensis]SCL24709.1 Glycosyl transferases group 1 [Micromonospora inyonensis]